MRQKALTMIHSQSRRVVAVDMSYRDAGVCILDRDGLSFTIKTHSLQNPKMNGIGFHALEDAHNQMFSNFTLRLRELLSEPYDALIVEMPCFTQSSKSAILIGMCWGIIAEFDAILVEPSALKYWSGAKKGDSKSPIKTKVTERVFLNPREQSNDNIVDAVGLALMFEDTISLLKHEYNANK